MYKIGHISVRYFASACFTICVIIFAFFYFFSWNFQNQFKTKFLPNSPIVIFDFGLAKNLAAKWAWPPLVLLIVWGLQTSWATLLGQLLSRNHVFEIFRGLPLRHPFWNYKVFYLSEVSLIISCGYKWSIFRLTGDK